MTRCGEHFQRGVAKGDFAAIQEGCTQWRQGGMRDADAHHRFDLFVHVLIDVQIFVVGFRPQTEVSMHESVAPHMVEVQVRVQQVLHFQSFAADVFLDVLPFMFVRTATIDDYSITYNP